VTLSLSNITYIFLDPPGSDENQDYKEAEELKSNQTGEEEGPHSVLVKPMAAPAPRKVTGRPSMPNKTYFHLFQEPKAEMK
jgi:hypothetical protein